jgi:hypothetical protein
MHPAASFGRDVDRALLALCTLDRDVGLNKEVACVESADDSRLHEVTRAFKGLANYVNGYLIVGGHDAIVQPSNLANAIKSQEKKKPTARAMGFLG